MLAVILSGPSITAHYRDFLALGGHERDFQNRRTTGKVYVAAARYQAESSMFIQIFGAILHAATDRAPFRVRRPNIPPRTA